MVEFQHLERLWPIMAAGAVIFFGYLLLMVRSSRTLKHFGGRKALRDQGSRVGSLAVDVFRIIAVCPAFLLFASAYWLAPQLKRVYEVPVYEGAEVCFVIDASRSSRAMDVRSADSEGREQVLSRYNFSKQIVQEARFALSPDDTPCLVFFAESAIITVPIFGFTDVAWEYIRSDLHYADEYFIEYEISQGSNFSAMVLKALTAFSDRPTKKILVVISDGEPEIGSADQAIEERRTAAFAELQKEAGKELFNFRKKHHLSVEFLGVGGTGAVPIPKRVGEDGAVLEYHTFISGSKNGQMVLTRPDPAFLLDAAQSLGGRYRHVRDIQDARKELSTILVREKRVLDWRKKEEITDAWRYFVSAGLVLLFLVPFAKSP